MLGYDWLHPDIHKPLCEILQDWKKNRRVRIILPRSWLKSTVCSIAYPIWRAINDSNVRCLLVQNSHTNAKAKLKSIRAHFERNEIFRALFPELLPDKTCTWTTESLCVKRDKVYNESTFEAAGRGTQLVGRHYNVIDEDDTVAPDKDEFTEDNVLPTKDDIDQAIGFHRSCIPMLVSPSEDQIIVVGTRWFQVDLLSWIGEKEGRVYVTYERGVRETDRVVDPSGVITWPEKFGEQTLRELEEGMGPYLFSCLYLNNPLRAEDMVFQPQWFQYYAEHPNRLRITITVDPAGNPKESVAKGKKRHDYNVVMVCGKNLASGYVYVLDYTQFKGGPGELIDVIFDYAKQYKFDQKGENEVGIEGVAYQESLKYFVEDRMRKENFYFNVKIIKHSGSSGSSKKEHRIRSLQPLVRSGSIRFKGWMNALISELQVFPLGKHDDLADALAMQLQMLDLTVLPGKKPAELDSSGFGLQEIIRSHLQRHRPPAGTVLDVLHKPTEGARDFDPYAWVDQREMTIDEYRDSLLGRNSENN